MLKQISVLVLLAVSVIAYGQRKKADKSPVSEEVKEFTLTSQVDSLSYAIGVSIGMNIIKNFDTLSPKALAEAISSVYDNEKTPLMTVEQATEFINNYFMGMVAKEANDNLKNAEAFLAENAKQEGVQVTTSGLQYKVIVEGEGNKPTAESRVEVHYKGTLIDGKEFDSSYRRGESATFGVGQVIPGWTEALQLMSEGSKYMLYIHPALAYGERGPESIGPNQLLIFEVELIDIVE